MKNYKRAVRRHHRERLINKYINYIKCRYGYDVPNRNSSYYPNTWEEMFLARYELARNTFDNFKKCSCHMCGNPRKFYKDKTLKEKLNDFMFNLDIGR